MLEPARLEFAADGTPFSPDHGDGYSAAHGGPERSRRVFLGGNDLPRRWQARDRFVILETGFGPGLNFLATWQAWRDDPERCRRLHFVSFEKHPFSKEDLAVVQRAWPEFSELASELQKRWPPLSPGVHRLSLDRNRVILTLVFGDPATQLRAIDASGDAFYLDEFSPAKDAEVWAPSLCKALARLAAPGATLAASSNAGPMREALAAAEFEMEAVPDPTGERPVLVGRFRSRRPSRHTPPAERRALVIGAGIAGSTAAWALAAAGWQVTVLESQPDAATGASGNLAGVLRPLPSADDNRLSRLTRAGYLATRRLLADLPDARWSPCGVMHLGRDTAHEAQQRRAVEKLGLPEDLLRFIDADTASAMLGRPVTTGGWWFPSGGWVQPPSLCKAALAAFPERISVRFNNHVDRLEPCDDGWRAVDTEGTTLATAPVVVVAGGVAGPRIPQLAFLPQRAARGQVSHLPADAVPPLEVVVCKQGYTAPAVDGLQLCGATLQSGDTGSELRLADHLENLERLERSLPGFTAGIDPARLGGKVGFRPMSPDRLPIVGPVPDASKVAANARLPTLPRFPGLWCVQGFGARGIVWSALMADLLVSRIEGEPLPLENDLVDAVDPGRFLLNKNARQMAEDSDDST